MQTINLLNRNLKKNYFWANFKKTVFFLISIHCYLTNNKTLQFCDKSMNVFVPFILFSITLSVVQKMLVFKMNSA